MLGLLRTIALVALGVIATLFFVQNLATTEVAFLTWSVSAPRAVVFAFIFVTGLTMGFLLVTLRPRRKQANKPTLATGQSPRAPAATAPPTTQATPDAD